MATDSNKYGRLDQIDKQVIKPDTKIQPSLPATDKVAQAKGKNEYGYDVQPK